MEAHNFLMTPNTLSLIVSPFEPVVRPHMETTFAVHAATSTRPSEWRSAIFRSCFTAPDGRCFPQQRRFMRRGEGTRLSLSRTEKSLDHPCHDRALRCSTAPSHPCGRPSHLAPHGALFRE